MKWIKIILFCCVLFMISCHKEDIVPIPTTKLKVDIFTQTETTISNGDQVMFKLTSDSSYLFLEKGEALFASSGTNAVVFSPPKKKSASDLILTVTGGIFSSLLHSGYPQKIP